MNLKKRAEILARRHIYILIALILFFVWFSYSYVSGGIVFKLASTDTTALTDFVSSFGNWEKVVFVLLVILEVVFAPVPPLGLYVVSGLLFGGFVGGSLILIGNVIGAFIDFKIARKIGEGMSQNFANEKIRAKFNKFFAKYGGHSIFILRINPLTTSDIVSYLAGFTKIKTRTFLISTTLGLIPMIYLQSYFGEIFIKGNPFLSAIVIFTTLVYLLLFIYLIIMSLLNKNKKSNSY